MIICLFNGKFKMIMKYGILSKDIWTIIIKFLPENFWKNIKRLNSHFEKLIKSDLMIKNMSFDDLCKKGYIESLLSFIKNTRTGDKKQNWNKGLYYACVGRHKEIVDLMMFNGADNFRYGLQGACTGGHLKIVKLMISKLNLSEDEYLNYPLRLACVSGNIKIVQLLISKGADDWNNGLEGACFRGNFEILDLMISKGANNWNDGLIQGCFGGQKEIVNLMISKGANNWNEALESICDGLITIYNAEWNKYIEILDLIISSGANNFNEVFPKVCSSGIIDLVNYMILKGANKWNWGIDTACRNFHEKSSENINKIIDLMILKGANYCDNCDNHKHPSLH